MIYFNRNFLSNVLNQQGEFNIYVDGQYLTIIDGTDLIDDVYGYGYDVHGKPTKFRYPNIQILKFGEETYDLVTLQKELEANPKEKDGNDDAEDSGDDPAEDDLENAPDEPGSEEEDTTEEEPKEKDPKESIKVGDFVLNEKTHIRGAVFVVEGNTVGYESYNPKTMRVESYVEYKRNLRIINETEFF